MPLVYGIRCTECLQSPHPGGGVAGYVATDGGKDGAILPEGYFALKLDDGTSVCLPHPIEDSSLREHGYSWRQAAREARLLWITVKICRSCGTLHEEARIHDGGRGCVPSVITSLLVLLGAKFALRWSWGWSLLLAYAVLLGVVTAAALFNRLRWRSENQRFTLRQCRSCGGRGFYTLSRARGKSLPCPFCKSRAMRCDLVGIS